MAKYNKIHHNIDLDHTDLDLDDLESPVLAGLDVPAPVFYCSIEAPSVSKQTEMEKALVKIQREDPSLQVDFMIETLHFRV